MVYTRKIERDSLISRGEDLELMRCMSLCIALVCVAVLITTTSGADERVIYCYGELDYQPHEDWHSNSDGCGGVDYLSGDVLPFWREFVVPRAGPFEVWTDQSYDPCEAEILDKLEDDYGGFAGPSVFIQTTDRQAPDSEQHIQALCIAFKEHERFIRGLKDKANEPGLFDDLARLSELKHLELYQLSMDSETFAQIGKLDQLEYLGLPHSTTDEALQYVWHLKKLKHLNASKTGVKGTTLKVITDLAELRTLDLRRNELAPGVLASLKGSMLETLLLSDTNVTDEDIEYLTDLPRLRNVGLHRTSISDESLAHLSNCKSLRYVSLYDTKTTEAGRRELMQARSELVVDAQRPPTLCEFIRERKYVHAWLGNKHVQYVTFATSLADKDPVESLQWFLVLKAKGSHTQDHLDAWMARVKKHLNEQQIAEAKARANAYLYLRERASFDIELEYRDGMPLYQYAF